MSDDKFKSQEFMRQLGLSFDVKMLEPNSDMKAYLDAKEARAKKTATVLGFVSKFSDKMLDPSAAINTHICNLIAAYGLKEVRAAFDKELLSREIDEDLASLDYDIVGGFPNE